jgi:hypothetical protein
MLVALLASVSAGIFAAHILDAFRTGQHAVDAWPSHSASDRAALRSRRSPPTPLQTPAPLQLRYDSNFGVRLLHVNDRFAPEVATRTFAEGFEALPQAPGEITLANCLVITAGGTRFL